MDGIEFARAIRLGGLDRPHGLQLAVQFKPPIDESKGGSAIVKEAAQRGAGYDLGTETSVELLGKGRLAEDQRRHTRNWVVVMPEKALAARARRESSTMAMRRRIEGIEQRVPPAGDLPWRQCSQQIRVPVDVDTDNLPKQGELVLEKVSPS